MKNKNNEVEINEVEIKQNETRQDYLLPASIVIAALLIAGAWIYTAGLKNIEPKKSGQALEKITPNIENVKPVSNDDHIFGNPNAEIKIIEFSDMECPFCKRFHAIMKQVINEYGDKVAWIYRHFPLEQLHPQAKKAAIASECATEIGGNNAFWRYLDQYVNLKEISSEESFSQIAENIDLNRNQFETCLNSDKFNEKINSQIEDAANSGVQGTPYSVIINKNNKKTSINGALPFEDFKDQYGKTQKGVKSLIEESLN
jgi:protein-disulfide isomerase